MIDVTVGDIPQLALGAVALPVIVWLLIRAAVYVGLLKTGQQKRVANIVLSLIGGGAWLLITLVPSLSGIVGLVVMAITGALGSALLYTKFGDGAA